MALDPRLHVRVTAGMPEHPKVEPLSDKAFRCLVEAWCLCRRSGNDGRIPVKSWTKRWTPKARREVLEAGLAHIEGDVVVMHDWLKHQPSASDLDAKSAARAEAGRKGGRKSGETRRTKGRQSAEPPTPDPAGPGPAPEGPLGPAVDATAWRMVRDIIPETLPQAVRTDLAHRAGALLKAGSSEADVRAGLSLWMGKTGVGPGLLASLVSDVVKGRTPAAAQAQPQLSAREQRLVDAELLKENPNPAVLRLADPDPAPQLRAIPGGAP